LQIYCAQCGRGPDTGQERRDLKQSPRRERWRKRGDDSLGSKPSGEINSKELDEILVGDDLEARDRARGHRHQSRWHDDGVVQGLSEAPFVQHFSAGAC